MRGVVSKGGGNASLVVERKEGMEKSKRARRRKPETAKTNLEPSFSWCLGGQGVRSDPESEGFEEKYRAVINGGHPEDEQVGQRWSKVEPALWGRRRYSFTHRTKVFADGTIRKILRDPRRAVCVLATNRVSAPISEAKWETMHRQESENVIVPQARDE
jgi:hypothetical protein